MSRITYADLTRPGLTRRRTGRGFIYRDARGRPVHASDVLARIKSLVIPPAWERVWISPTRTAHIQAVGRDARGRRQYIYHPHFRAEREAAKYSRLFDFARVLPHLRAAIEADLTLPGLPRDKVLATVARLLDRTFIRVGNAEYADKNASFGLSTLRDRHAAVSGESVRFAFKGKGGKEWRVSVRDRRVARIVKACQDLPGQALFQYLDGEGRRRSITSGDINAYLRAKSGRQVSAKDFRTWAGTVLCAASLAARPGESVNAPAKRRLADAVREVARRLGNTPAVCRACYVHPAIVAAFEKGEWPPRPTFASARDNGGDLAKVEAAVLRILARAAGETGQPTRKRSGSAQRAVSAALA